MYIKQNLLICFFICVCLWKFQAEAAAGPSHGKVVVCYLGSWAVYRPGRGSFAIENTDPSLCTHVIYSFAGLDMERDSIKPLDKWQDLTENGGLGGYQRITNLKNKYTHLKVNLAIGGWNEGSKNYSQMSASPNRRARFITSVVDTLRKYNFDGLDLDWEFPGKRGGAPEDKMNFLLLVKELKAAFRKHNFLLTAAFGAGKDTIDIAYDVERLSNYLDFIHMMCYDYHGAWDRKTGANAPLRSSDDLSVEYSINYMLKLGAPPKKLVLGIPLYGRTFMLEDRSAVISNKKARLGLPTGDIGFQGPFTRENGFMGYNEICLELKNKSANWKTFWDSESQTPYAVSGSKVITYDNEQSIIEKVRFAIENNLAGIMVWSIETDDFQGDCSDNEEEDSRNFPLLRCINKSIEQALKDIENNIIHRESDKTNSAIVNSFSNVLISLIAIIVAVLN